MPLLNYSTRVPAARTAAEVQALLARAGAREVLMRYEGGRVVGLAFSLWTPRGERSFALPVDPAPVEQLLARQGVARGLRTPEQAERVAWRIVKDWVEAQVALCETEMVTLDQVMLPYMLVDGASTTLYRRFLDGPGLPEIDGAGTVSP